MKLKYFIAQSYIQGTLFDHTKALDLCELFNLQNQFFHLDFAL